MSSIATCNMQFLNKQTRDEAVKDTPAFIDMDGRYISLAESMKMFKHKI